METSRNYETHKESPPAFVWIEAIEEMDIDSILKLIEKERSHPKVDLSNERRLERKKTFMLIDNTPAEKSFKVFERSSKFVIFDAKLLHRKKFVRNSSLGNILDEYRNILAFAILHGKILVIRLQDVAVDFLNTFCDEGYFEQHGNNHHNADLVENNPYPPYEKWWYLPRGFMLNHGEMLRRSPFPYCLFRRNDWNEIKAEYGDEYGPEKFLNDSMMLLQDTNEVLPDQGKSEKSLADSLQDMMLDNHHDEEEFEYDGHDDGEESHKKPKGVPMLFSSEFRIVITTTIPLERVEDMLFNGRFGLPGTSSQYRTIVVK